MSRMVLHLMGMDCSKYGSFERFNVELSATLASRGYRSVFVYEEEPVVKKYVTDLKATGAKIVIINSRKNVLLFCYLLLKLLCKYDFCLMHAHFTKARFYAIPLAWFVGLRNIVYTLHSEMPTLSEIKIHTRLWYKWANTKCRIITVSQQIQSVVLQNWPNAKVNCCYMGVRPIKGDKYQMREELCLPHEKVIIQCTANFNFIKGLDLIIEAAKVLKANQRLDNLLFVIIGQPEKDKEEMMKWVEDNNLSSYFRLEGIKNNVAAYLCAADIYIQPSRSEGVPLSIMEATSIGLPIIAAKVGGIPEVAVEGKNALLFEKEDYKALAEYIESLVKDSSIRTDLGNNSWRIYEEKFNVKTNVDRLIDYYKLP